MSNNVPDSNNDDASIPASHHRSGSNSSGIPLLGNQMAELTWQNGQPEVNGLNNLNSCTIAKEAWEMSGAAVGTLESIVDFATQNKRRLPAEASNVDVPWLDPRSHSRGGSQSAASACNMDALVPCVTPATEDGISTGHVGGSARVEDGSMLKRARQQATRVSVDGEYCGVQGSQNGGKHVLSPDSYEKGSGGFGVTTASFWSQGGTLSLSGSENRAGSNKTATLNDHDSVHLTSPQEDTSDKEDKSKETVRSSLSTKRSRAAAVHNQSERKRREMINQKLKMLQKMVPNSSKTDKASMLDEVIECLKQLQAQVHLMTMSRMSMPSMMMPFAMPQQQLHMPIMSPMGMGMGMDMNIINPTIMARQNLAGLSSVISPNAAFMPMAPTDPSLQPMTIEAYSRMIALIQHHQMASTTSKN